MKRLAFIDALRQRGGLGNGLADVVKRSKGASFAQPTTRSKQTHYQNSLSPAFAQVAQHVVSADDADEGLMLIDDVELMHVQR